VTACQGASTESLAAGYSALASAANAASAPLLATLVSTEDTAARAPVLRGLADVEKTFADGLAALPASGEAKAAVDEVVRLAREREAAFRTAAQATGARRPPPWRRSSGKAARRSTRPVERLRSVLGLPPTDASPTPGATTPDAATPRAIAGPPPADGAAGVARPDDGPRSQT